jgi:hypothetical protein
MMSRIGEVFDWEAFIAELEASPAARRAVAALHPGSLGVVAYAQEICRCIESRIACLAALETLAEEETR